ncbi:MAG: hypothetical protein ACXVLQ_05000 [Bacteriovorax sp.]
MNKIINLFISLSLLMHPLAMRAATPDCHDKLTKEIHQLLTSEHQKILSLQYQLTLLKMSKLAHQENQETVLEESAIEKRATDIQKSDPSTLKKLNAIYQTFGKRQDLTKLQENIDGGEFFDEDASTYIEARILLEENQALFNETDAAIMWLVQNATNSKEHANVSEQLAALLESKSPEAAISELTNQINEEFQGLANHFTKEFKSECLDSLLQESCQNQSLLIDQQLANQINLLIDGIKNSKSINLTLEDKIKEDYSGMIEFKILPVREKIETEKKPETEAEHAKSPGPKVRAKKQKKRVHKKIKSTKKANEKSKMAIDDYDPKNIEIEITNPHYKTEDSAQFVNALEEEKPKLMKLYHLSNQEYNQLAAYAFGVMGNESKMGNSLKYKVKEKFPLGVAYMKEWKRNVINKAEQDYEDGKNAGGLLNGVKKGTASYIEHLQKMDEKIFTGKLTTESNSRGPTQIKRIPKLISENYGIKNEELADPKKAAVATLGFLADSLEIVKHKEASNPNINAKNRLDYIHYIYNGSSRRIDDGTATPEHNIYLRNLKKYQEGVTIKVGNEDDQEQAN